MGVAQMNALDAARLGLGTVTHFYGLFEAMYENHDVQPWPADMNYNNEQHRFGHRITSYNVCYTKLLRCRICKYRLPRQAPLYEQQY